MPKNVVILNIKFKSVLQFPDWLTCFVCFNISDKAHKRQFLICPLNCLSKHKILFISLFVFLQFLVFMSCDSSYSLRTDQVGFNLKERKKVFIHQFAPQKPQTAGLRAGRQQTRLGLLGLSRLPAVCTAFYALLIRKNLDALIRDRHHTQNVNQQAKYLFREFNL